jgi:CheY-like chemotaxis protein
MIQTGSFSKKKLRVLIADDIQETRRNTRLMLSMISDVEVVAIASNGLQAVQMAKECHPDIVVLDINMPDNSWLLKELQSSPHRSLSPKDPKLPPAMSSRSRSPVQTSIRTKWTGRKKSARLGENAAGGVSGTATPDERRAFEQLANECAKATDDQAVEVYEHCTTGLRAALAAHRNDLWIHRMG